MTRGEAAWYAVLAMIGVAMVWILFVALPRRYGPKQAVAPAPTAPPPAAPIRKITARLFYVSQDGSRLTAMESDVPFGEGVTEQAKRILEAQLAVPAQSLVSPLPSGTKLRTLYVTDRGEAFVDLSREVSVGHPGGSLNEILTVYTIVNALTANLPAITAVQILIDGREADTLAGHVDLRRPLQKDLRWVDTGTAAPPQVAGGSPPP